MSDAAVEVDTGGRLNHIGWAVRDLGAALEWHRAVLGGVEVGREYVELDDVDEVMVDLGGARIQLVCPRSDRSPVAKFLAKRGEGLHHVGYDVSDLAQAVTAAEAGGARLIEPGIRPGSGGGNVAFLHPKSVFGALVELVERSASTSSDH